MATLALSLAGQFVGGLVGGPFGAMAGRALGALAGSAVDGVLFGERRQPGASDIRIQGSSEGGAVPRLYGWARLSGNIIWARELELLDADGSGAKGMGSPDAEQVGASFAVAFCEGEVQRLGRIWADGQLLDTDGLTLRFYRGTEDQFPDGLIEATQGIAPAYRGICYLVVEQLPLGRFGNRIPQLSVELCRPVGDLEPSIRAITVIPGATEFGYDPVPRVRVVSPGVTAAENMHLTSGVSDWTVSIDELVALCPNLERVALVVAWFGDDLRCEACRIGPRVEAANRQVTGTEWSVAGFTRDEVPVVSTHDGGPAYGGTPSDAAVLAAIADLKARGLQVTLYPMVMMDVPADNGLPDPYGWGEQAAYPWRGRITCHPAAGQSGSPDGTSAAVAQVASFAARYREMVLHYAALGAAAGGLDALVIGSELRGLTGIRGPGNSFPFVEALVALAADVRAVVGTGTKLTYAADWSEYGGVQGGGEKFFHLDPLWASPDIDAVGIDNYMPLADWRDGNAHLDANQSGYDLDYLSSNIAGGEGFDWYYGSEADRAAQLRSPITDGAYGEHWVWRFKDLVNWWSQPHHDRPSGVRSASSTAWVPRSKPIWFTELGCGAVDKGANQPNIIGDSKSAEGGRPYFSKGTPDPLIQRQFLRAHQRWWNEAANNPPGMVDISRIYLWTWDARPYPAFPAMTEVWTDGVNHRTGHWLTGRLGVATPAELAEAVAAEHGVELRAEPSLPVIAGYVLAETTSGREALEPLMSIAGLRLRNDTDSLRLSAPKRGNVALLALADLSAGEGADLTQRRDDPAEAASRLALSYIDRERDYLAGTVTALTDAVGSLEREAYALTLDGEGARVAAERLLIAKGVGRETLTFELPPSRLALEPGDLVDFVCLAGGPFEVSEIRDGLRRRVTARSLPAEIAVAIDPDRPMLSVGGAAVPALPVIIAAHLPAGRGSSAHGRLVVGGFAQPWPGALQVTEEVTGAPVVDLSRRAVIGRTASGLTSGVAGMLDGAAGLDLQLLAGHLSSVTAEAVLAGANRLAVQNDAGAWEVIGFQNADLLGPGHFRISGLVRGTEGTADRMHQISEGRGVMLLDGRVGVAPVEAEWLGSTRGLRVYAGHSDLTGTTHVVSFS